MKIQPGHRLPPVRWDTVDSKPVDIPDPHGRIVHLQFSRWAGCPICNTHLGELRRRAADVEQAGVVEVIVFHSPPRDVTELRGDLPFALVADPERNHYRSFGVKKSLLFLCHTKAFRSFWRERKLGRTAQRIHGGVLGLPADFLIAPDGLVIAAHYGRHADDNLPVDEVLRLALNQRRSAGRPER